MKRKIERKQLLKTVVIYIARENSQPKNKYKELFGGILGDMLTFPVYLELKKEDESKHHIYFSVLKMYETTPKKEQKYYIKYTP